MIPITLAAAAEVQLARCDEEAIGLAVRAWVGPVDDEQARTPTLLQWWETYCAMRPAWRTPLQQTSLANFRQAWAAAWRPRFSVASTASQTRLATVGRSYCQSLLAWTRPCSIL